jgi:hypothetical protein
MVQSRRNRRAAVDIAVLDAPANDDTSDDLSTVASGANSMSVGAKQVTPAGRRFRLLH